MTFLLGKHKVYQIMLTIIMVVGLLFPTGGIVRAEETDPPVAPDPIISADSIVSSEAVIEDSVSSEFPIDMEVQPASGEDISPTEAVAPSESVGSPTEVIPPSDPALSQEPLLQDGIIDSTLVTEVAALAEVGATLTENGEAVSMASNTAADSLENADPYFTRGGITYSFFQTGGTCSPSTLGVTCFISETPIQDAINKFTAITPLTGDENTIYVLPGIYTENITINVPNLILYGAPGSITTIGPAFNAPVLQGNGGTGVQIKAEGVTITGFIIQGYDIGIYVSIDSGKNVINISDNKITNNDIGIKVVKDKGSPGVEIHYNQFVDNDVAVENNNDNNIQNIEAQNNFWGCSSGPVVYGSLKGKGGAADQVGYWDVYTATFIGTDLPDDCQLLDGYQPFWDHQKNTSDWSPFKISLDKKTATLMPMTATPVTLTNTATDVPNTPTAVPPTATPVTPTNTATDVPNTPTAVPPTATPVTPTNTATDVPNTPTAVPPTATPVTPTNTATDVPNTPTAVPPTATPVTPTNTATDVPKTPTAIPPTATPVTPTNTATDVPNTPTAIPPTATPVTPTNTATDVPNTPTAVPPTATPVTPTNTATDVPNTPTAVPPTATPVTPTNTATDVPNTPTAIPPTATPVTPTNTATDVPNTPTAVPLTATPVTPINAVTTVPATPTSVPLIPVTGATLIPLAQAGFFIPVTGGSRIIAAGLDHTCMTVGTEVVCWGLNDSGQLGNGDFITRLIPNYVLNLNNVIDLTAGSLFTCALTDDGKVWCWGENSSGQLGNGNTQNSNVPVLVKSLPGSVSSFTAGNDFACAKLATAEIWCWGNNQLGQLNDGTKNNHSTPVMAQVSGDQNLISGGQDVLFSDSTAGEVGAWKNKQTELVSNIVLPQAISANRFAPGGCASTLAGTVTCWKSDLESEKIDGITAALLVDTGLNHSCTINEDLTVSCWGANPFGELGNGTTNDSEAALAVPNLSSVQDLALGEHHTCVLTGDGLSALCWGENSRGQLGNNSTNNSSSPVLVSAPIR